MANSSSGESVLTRVVRILSAFDSRRTTMSVSELARRVRLPHSTTHRLVGELVAEGLLERGHDGAIRLGRRLWELGSRGSETATLRHVALPFMEDVQAVVRQHTVLGVLDGDDVLYLERLSSPASTIQIVPVAGRLPAHATSAGHVLLAHSPREVQERFFGRPLERFTDTTPADEESLRRNLADVRGFGFSMMRGIIVPASTGIAVPVFERGERVVAALGTIVPRGEEDLSSIVPALTTAARGISRALGSNRPSIDPMNVPVSLRKPSIQ